MSNLPGAHNRQTSVSPSARRLRSYTDITDMRSAGPAHDVHWPTFGPDEPETPHSRLSAISVVEQLSEENRLLLAYGGVAHAAPRKPKAAPQFPTAHASASASPSFPPPPPPPPRTSLSVAIPIAEAQRQAASRRRRGLCAATPVRKVVHNGPRVSFAIDFVHVVGTDDAQDRHVERTPVAIPAPALVSKVPAKKPVPVRTTPALADDGTTALDSRPLRPQQDALLRSGYRGVLVPQQQQPSPSPPRSPIPMPRFPDFAAETFGRAFEDHAFEEECLGKGVDASVLRGVAAETGVLGDGVGYEGWRRDSGRCESILAVRGGFRRG
ncbi:hypothetical protein EJ03DRAFT_351877 [Teratosphaeria nubilosa]|uniref:Uncharacterized protein n=1 Tax=Teratosphaeria nubilosa TaxID=161662 RepID=A0A6G1L8X0_9PEZI|nr:hypothetical protein EJ03DRAFT_351877 [Teratosphaeria nubilosa]